MKDLCKYEHLENVSSFLYHLKIFFSPLRHLNFFSFLRLCLCCISMEQQPFDSELNARVIGPFDTSHSVEV